MEKDHFVIWFFLEDVKWFNFFFFFYGCEGVKLSLEGSCEKGEKCGGKKVETKNRQVIMAIYPKQKRV